MLITSPSQLTAFFSDERMWQGIPGIERTAKGRLFATFYSGGRTETLGNYSLLLKSDDGGKSFSEPIAVAYYGEAMRSYDPALWIDPLGRLWFFWGVYPENRVDFTVCNDPDADTLLWEPVRTLGHDVMINKPTVLSNGDWLFPCSVWDPGIRCNINTWGPAQNAPTGAHAYVSQDMGKTFSLRGTAIGPERSFDEHMILEKKDGTLAMYLRTSYGIGYAESKDKGKSWTEVRNSGIPGPVSRIHVRRLQSGRVLLINHHNFTGRNNLTAFLSEDDGATFPYSLLLEPRNNASYPDAVEGSDGYLYIIYDHERGALYHKGNDYESHAREILMAKITEEDILRGELHSPAGALSVVVSRLGFRKTPEDYFEKK